MFCYYDGPTYILLCLNCRYDWPHRTGFVMDYLKVEDFRHEKKINAIVYQFDRKSQDDSAADNQCDQMARLFVKYLAI